MGFEIGAPTFDLDDVKIAAWNGPGSFGSAVDVMSAQALTVTMRTVSGELVGDGKITAAASRAIAGQIVFRFGGVSIAALEVMLGLTATSSIASPNNVKTFRIAGGERMPSFAIIGKAFAEAGGGATEVFMPMCKIMTDFTLIQMEYGQFAIPEVTVLAVADDDYGIINVIPVETPRALTIPPLHVPTIA